MMRVLVTGCILTALLGGGGLFLLEGRGIPEEFSVVRDLSVIARASEERVPDVTDRVVQVPILVYHAVRPFEENDGPLSRQYTTTPPMFEAHLKYLKDGGYVTIGFSELEDAILHGGALPEKPIILTFDDGTWSHYANAFPLLATYGFTGTFFVFSNAIDRPGYFTSAEMREMRDAGMSFGNHTRYHQYLTRVPAEEAMDEMRTGKARIEEVLGEEVGAIAYPFGLYDDAVVEVAAMLGHRFGRTIKEGRSHGAEDLMTLDAYQMYDSMSRLEYALGRP